MSSPRIYLDHIASAPLRPEARAAMLAALERDGNASSVHLEGRAMRQLIEDAREQVADSIGAKASEVVFTSGATEANNMALNGGWETIRMAGVEHESVVTPVVSSGAAVLPLPVDSEGAVDVAKLAEIGSAEAEAGGKHLLTLQMANNETGVVQDVATAASIAKAQGVSVHTDAVQACGRLQMDFASLGVDTMSVSSHKVGGPTGVGALIIRDGFDLRSFVQGGGQERRRRAGTENAAAIAGFGAAARAAKATLEIEACRLANMRRTVEKAVLSYVPNAVVVGAGTERLPNTACISLPGDLAETTVIKLDLAGVAISAGSACSSGKVGASHVLTAMGLPIDVARSAIRISLGWNTTDSSLEEFLTRFSRLFAQENRAVA